MSRRILIGKPGLDGHDRGAHYVARILRDAGYEVIYTGLRQTVQQIVSAAIDEDADLVGLSVLSGAHLELARAVRTQLDESGGRDVPIVLGGVVPDEDYPQLRDIGVAAVLGPESTPDEIVDAVAVAMDGGPAASGSWP